MTNQTKLPVQIVEHGYNSHSDWTVNRNDQVEALVRIEAGREIKFSVPDKNGRYELAIREEDLEKALTALGWFTNRR